MSVLMGNFSLSLAVLVSLLALLMSIGAVKLQNRSVLGLAKLFLFGLFALLTLGSVALVVCLIQSDMSVEYVARYTERSLPTGYKLAAFWAGQEGSLLLWGWLLAGMAAVAALNLKTEETAASIKETASVLATLSLVCGFFAALLLFAANPFKVQSVIPMDGHGLNPMLQDPGMIAHPPLLFLGYAGYTIPFALLVGALVSGRRDNEWIAATRRWALVSWLFLSIGIILGAQWAYVELGWGGYWAWDPVENASLLPWLTGTALLHSIMVQQQRGMFRKWNAWLIAATFILCIFGTYITRSGIIDSVHAFGASLVGTFFLLFLIGSITFSVVLILLSNQLLKGEHELENLAGKEGFFLATSVLLVAMTAITLIGTMFPVLSEAMTGQKVTVGPSFYNKVVAPLGLVLAGFMATGPALVYGKQSGTKLIQGLLAPAMVGVSAVIVAVALGLRNGWALATVAIAAIAVCTIVVDLVRSLIARCRVHGESVATAIVKLLENNHRRYGAQITHLGVIMIVIGVTGSSLFVEKETFAIRAGESVQFAGRTLTMTSLDQMQEVNYVALQATLTMTGPDGKESTLRPQFRRYNKWEEQLNSEVSISSNWKEDVYVTLAASDGTGGVTIQAIINPAVSWIWTGGITLSLGAIVALLPRVRGQVVPAEEKPVRKQAKASRGKARVQVST